MSVYANNVTSEIRVRFWVDRAYGVCGIITFLLVIILILFEQFIDSIGVTKPLCVVITTGALFSIFSIPYIIYIRVKYRDHSNKIFLLISSILYVIIFLLGFPFFLVGMMILFDVRVG